MPPNPFLFCPILVSSQMPSLHCRPHLPVHMASNIATSLRTMRSYPNGLQQYSAHRYTARRRYFARRDEGRRGPIWHLSRLSFLWLRSQVLPCFFGDEQTLLPLSKINSDDTIQPSDSDRSTFWTLPVCASLSLSSSSSSSSA